MHWHSRKIIKLIKTKNNTVYTWFCREKSVTVLLTKKQNCSWQVLSNTRQNIHSRPSYLHTERAQLTPLVKRTSSYTAHPLIKQPKDTLPSVASPYMSPGWSHPESTLSGGAQVQIICFLCSLGQSHPFTSCLITSSSPHLTVSLQLLIDLLR